MVVVAGRLRRIMRELEDDGQQVACMAVTTYDPRAFASVLTVGLGVAGGLGGGGKAVGQVVDDVLRWGDREVTRVVPLPHKVLAIVAEDAVTLCEWDAIGGRGKQQVQWKAGEPLNCAKAITALADPAGPRGTLPQHLRPDAPAIDGGRTRDGRP